MADWFTLADLAAFLQYDIDTATGALVRATAQAAIRAATRQQIDYVTGDVIDLDTDGTRRAFLPQLPVVNVTSVAVFDPVSQTFMAALQPSGFAWSRMGELTRTYGASYYAIDNDASPFSHWPRNLRALRVTYDHGYVTVPPELVEVAKMLAARLYSNPQGLLSESIGDYAVRYEGNRSAGLDFNPLELGLLREFRNPRLRAWSLSTSSP